MRMVVFSKETLKRPFLHWAGEVHGLLPHYRLIMKNACRQNQVLASTLWNGGFTYLGLYCHAVVVSAGMILKKSPEYFIPKRITTKVLRVCQQIYWSYCSLALMAVCWVIMVFDNMSVFCLSSSEGHFVIKQTQFQFHSMLAFCENPLMVASTYTTPTIAINQLSIWCV